MRQFNNFRINREGMSEIYIYIGVRLIRDLDV